MIEVTPKSTHTWNFFRLSDPTDHQRLVALISKNVVGSKFNIENSDFGFFRDPHSLCLLFWVSTRGAVSELPGIHNYLLSPVFGV